MQRSGVTLTEVLVAIFIMGIGLLSLLTLFPLGALNMAQAIKDERVTMAAQNGFALARLNIGSTTPQAAYPLTGDLLLTNPTNLYLNPNTAIWATIPGTLGLSYPIYADPQGCILLSNQVGKLGASPGFPRAKLSFVQSQAQVARFLTVLDDITFTENGIADLTAGSLVREGRYTWAYFIRAKPSTNPPQDGADVYVVMYEKRSLAGALSSSSAPPDETAYSADFGFSSGVASPTSATIKNAAAAPIKKGTWILDATVYPNPPGQPSLLGGFFYRVVGVTPDPNNLNDVVVEFQSPVQQQYPSGAGVAVVMEGVVEVFKAP